MNRLKNIFAIVVVLLFAAACEKEIDNLDKLDGVKSPANISATFNIAQDNSGLVTIMPQGEGVTGYLVKFGDNPDEEPVEYDLDEVITHVYDEGVYTVEITAIGLTGLTATYTAELTVSFRAPENLEVNIEADEVNPRKISVTATADYATVMDIYFGDTIDEVPVTVLPGETASNIYEEPGDYIITVEAKSGGEASTVFSDTITVEAASDPVTLPIDFESFTINYGFSDFGGAASTVIDNPDPTGINTSDRVAEMVKTANAETWAGSLLTLGSPIDFTTNKLFKMKVWSPKTGAVVKLKVENLDNGDISHEVDATTTVSNEWEELEYDFSDIDITNEYQKVVVFFDFGNVGDGTTYYFDDIKLTSGAPPSTGIAGTWKMAPEAGSLGVGPEQGDISWWSIDEQGLAERDCFFDDEYVFGADGSFTNVLGSETWIEDWQGMNPPGCGTPVAPHDGTAVATYTYIEGEGTVTIDGTGAYLGLPKVYNGGELEDPANAPESITYIIELSDNDTRMTLDISIGGGWWRFILVKEGGVSSPLAGTWQMAPEAGSLGVGPEQGDISWWSINDQEIIDRACFFDDEYVFGADGSFSNVPGSETWLEEWQGMNPPECGTPVAPHDGTAVATYEYDAGEGTVTINGTGAYLGISKVYNGGELTDPSGAVESITYIIELSENDTRMTLDISIGGAWWRFILVKI
ncbi:MAG: hypothetical protein ACOCX8_00095 [Bacteroidota bacterium]